MTDLAEFLARATDDVAATRKVGSETQAAYDELDPSARQALRRVAAFLGHPDGAGSGSGDPATVDEENRRRIAGLLLLRFAVDTDEPVWSSKALEDLVEA